MPRSRRVLRGGVVYHIYNRGSRKGPLFGAPQDYNAFVHLLSEARARYPVRIVAYCLMPNHWHFLLWPWGDSDLSQFMQWLTGTHAFEWRQATKTQGQGAVYQSRFNDVPIGDAWHYFNALCYIERNAAAAGLVPRAEDWEWSSASALARTSSDLPLDEGPMERPADWLVRLNQNLEDEIIF